MKKIFETSGDIQELAQDKFEDTNLAQIGINLKILSVTKAKQILKISRVSATTQFLTKMFANMNYAGAVYLLILCVVPMLVSIVPQIRGFWYAGIALVILSTVVVEMVTLLENGIKEEDDKKKSNKPTKNVKAFKQ